MIDIKQICKDICQVLFYLYDQLTYPIGVKTINNHKVSIRPDGFFFTDYPFKPASIYPSGLVSYSHIKEIVICNFPPEIRTKDEEILFITDIKDKKLETVALKNNIALVSKVDVWSYILEPFLDTESTEKQKEETLQLLEKNNISRQECKKLRDFVEQAMTAYNFTSGLWEWFHLGLFDVLLAFTGFLSGHRHKLSDKKFKEFYHQAMEIANRGKLINNVEHTNN
ncbi:MAG: hypothetical protein WAQ98_14000 [Blastocatellia bacterium]